MRPGHGGRASVEAPAKPRDSDRGGPAGAAFRAGRGCAEPQIACAVQVVLYSAIAFVATFFAPETKGRDLTLVEDAV